MSRESSNPTEPRDRDDSTARRAVSRTGRRRGTTTDADVLSWLRSRAHPLVTLEPGSGTADLDPLREAWRGARVVGLGESTHGTREFFTLKHRIVRLLVEELDTTVFALEASEAAAEAVDGYVRRGVGDPAVALAGLRFWTWNTREMLDLLTWMRRHNAHAPVERQVRFVGIDPQRPEAAVDVVGDHVRRFAPAELAEAGSVLDDLRTPSLPTAPPLPGSTLQRISRLRDVVRSTADDSERGRAAVRHAGAVARWLAGPTLTRSHGAVVSWWHRFAFAPVSPGEQYDGLAYVHEGHPSTPCATQCATPTGNRSGTATW